MKGLKLPQIDSIEELARFWDTHDLTEFEEELEEVAEPVFERKPDTVIPLHLQPQELEAVKRVARLGALKRQLYCESGCWKSCTAECKHV